jgi:hypothetical protein
MESRKKCIYSCCQEMKCMPLLKLIDYFMLLLKSKICTKWRKSMIMIDIINIISVCHNVIFAFMSRAG